MFLLFMLASTAALYSLLSGVCHLLYTGAETEAAALVVAQVYLRMLGFMRLTVTFCFLTENSLQDMVAFALLSSNAMFILIIMTLLTGPLKNNVGCLQLFLYISILCSVQTDILTGKSFVGMFVPAIGVYMLLPLSLALSGFRKKELSF